MRLLFGFGSMTFEWRRQQRRHKLRRNKMNSPAVVGRIARGVMRLAAALRGPTLGEQITNLHTAYCHSQRQFLDADAVLRAVQADLSAYHKSDDDRISVAMARIQMWRDGKPGARLYSRPEVDAMLASELERIAHEPPVSGNEIAQARVLLAAAQLRGA